jgi:hypothetical protein
MRFRTKKWDAAIASEHLSRVTGKEKAQLKALNNCKGGYRVTSMLRKIVHMRNFTEEKRMPILLEIGLTEEKYNSLYAFCRSIFDASWRPYTPAEEAMHAACKQFQQLKRSRKPLEWVWEIGFLPEEERAHTACVIWWDIFADRECNNRFKPFDQWLDGFRSSQCISTSSLRKNLIKIGYPALVAERRVLSEDLEETTETESK